MTMLRAHPLMLAGFGMLSAGMLVQLPTAPLGQPAAAAALVGAAALTRLRHP